MAKRYVYIISDLHLGGAAPDEDKGCIGFQMCPPQSRQRLAEFVDYCRTAHADGETELVINGDFIDFLAEQRITSDGADPETPAFDAFTLEPKEAVRKFERVVSSTDENAPEGKRLFEQLQAFVGAGHTLTILLGNHDIELAMPPVRRALSELLTKGRPARVEFLHDGEAYARNNLLIEHGNRYDGWNMVPYGRLRAYRSAISRGENPPLMFDAPPGSHLVVNVMNALKRDYRFIDLLKPENEALIPFLAKLEPTVIRHLAEVVSLLRRATRVDPKPGGVPESETMIAARNSHHTAAPDRTVAAGYDDPIDESIVEVSEKLLRLADEEAEEEGIAEADANIGAFTEKIKGTLRSARGLYSILRQFPSLPKNRLRNLRKSLITYRDLIGSTFDLQTEVPRYLNAAHRLSGGGRIVVFGHTHLAKQIRFPEGGLYLNTGTWCPTIQLPTDYSDPAEPEAQVLDRLQEFVKDMQTNKVEKHSRLRMTFAKIVIGNDRAEGGLFEWPDHGTIPQPLS
jgi:UDP-2,3-diacylglucosamine pyrophosphatase LpxH